MKTTLTVLLLGAARRVGKDTVANMLESEVNTYWGAGRARKMSFAEELRFEVSEALMAVKWPIDVDTTDPEVKEKIVRPLLVAWGAGRRAQDPDYWVDKVIGKLGDYAATKPAGHALAILSDWRYPNELLKIQKAQYRTVAVYIERPGSTFAGEEAENAPRCRELADFVLKNEGTLDDLGGRVLEFLYGHKGLFTKMLR